MTEIMSPIDSVMRLTVDHSRGATKPTCKIMLNPGVDHRRIAGWFDTAELIAAIAPDLVAERDAALKRAENADEWGQREADRCDKATYGARAFHRFVTDWGPVDE